MKKYDTFQRFSSHSSGHIINIYIIINIINIIMNTLAFEFFNRKIERRGMGTFHNQYKRFSKKNPRLHYHNINDIKKCSKVSTYQNVIGADSNSIIQLFFQNEHFTTSKE